MALHTSRAAARRALPCQWNAQPAAPALVRSLSTSGMRAAEGSASAPESAPRWSQTPRQMVAPFSPHTVKNESRRIWKVNSDPKKLDEALVNFLGRDGNRLLPEEIKWLAVTHRSFDHGRRGFNDRLAYLGRQICILEVTQSIINAPPRDGPAPAPANDPFAGRRQPFEDPALRSLDNLTTTQPADLFTFHKLARLANDTGLSNVVRWKPRMPDNVMTSGLEPVLSGVIYAIVGAIASQNGGKVASRIVRERILKKLR